MNRKQVMALMISCTVAAGLLSACGQQGAGTAPEQAAGPEVEAAAKAQEASVSDEEAASRAADLIDAIYVQERTEDTDRLCQEAREAWDALTDEQKELVEGQYADPDYFGLDTGDASRDDPLNADAIGEDEILVVSFGTSFNDSRTEDIGGIEKAIAAAYPDWSVRRAFTAQIIINHIQARDGIRIDNMDQALERAASNGVKRLLVQPTHLMRGAEYDDMVEAVANYADAFESVMIAEPMLGPVGEDETVINADKEAAMEAMVEAGAADAGYADMAEAAADGTAYVYMGHGTSHNAKITYSQMQTVADQHGYENAFVGTVEGEPEDTSCQAVMEKVRQAGYKKVILRPMMVVAGDHANNDMAGEDEDSWRSMFEASGAFDAVETQIAGMGSIPAIQAIYVDHVAAALESGQQAIGSEQGTGSQSEVKAQDGTYEIKVDSSSKMFNIEACTLEIKDGNMTATMTMGGTGYSYICLGSKDYAETAPETEYIYPEEVDGVHRFTLPVDALDTEIECAAFSKKKSEWYDRRLTFRSDGIPAEALTGLAIQDAGGLGLSDGEYRVAVSLEGGSGRAGVESPALLQVVDGQARAELRWSSNKYDYMLVDGEKLQPVSTDPVSVFMLPVSAFDRPISVLADTTAMSQPREIEYRLIFDQASITGKE